jgi:hypothetical protein
LQSNGLERHPTGSKVTHQHVVSPNWPDLSKMRLFTRIIELKAAAYSLATDKQQLRAQEFVR